MSGRNFSPKKGPLGKFRRSVEAPPLRPEVNIEGLLDVAVWRAEKYPKAILDDLLGHRRFEPATREMAYTYAGGNSPFIRRKAVGRKAVQEVLKMDRSEMIAAAERQKLHTAEGVDRNLGLFSKIASVRAAVLENALVTIKARDPRGLPSDVAAYAAGSIEDFGLCLEEPYDKQDERAPGSAFRPTLLDRIDRIAPGIGRQVASFGAYAIVHPEALESYEGITLLELTLEEQGYRVSEWDERRVAMAQAFPGVMQDMSYLDTMSLQDMLRVQSDLAA